MIILSFNILPQISYSQQKNPRVSFLFQSIYDRNQIELAANNELNILYINERCLKCFSKITQLESNNPKLQYIVVTATNTWQAARTAAEKEEKLPEGIMKKIYYDPGRRFEKAFKLGNNDNSFLRYSNGKITGNYGFSFTQYLGDPYRLKIWK